MSIVLQSIIGIANVSISLAIEVINGLSYLLARNYEFVSFLVQLLFHCFNGVRSMIAGFLLAISDFQDQYGDFCVALVKNAIDIIGWIFRLAINAFYSISKLFQSIIDCLRFAVGLPISIGNFLIESISAITSMVQSIPTKSIDLVIDGFSLLGSLVFYAIVGILSAIGNFIKSIIDLMLSILGRSKIDNEFLNTETTRSINFEASIGLLIVIGMYLIYMIEPNFLLIVYRKVGF